MLILDNLDNIDLLSEVKNAGQRGQGTRVDGERRQLMSVYLPQSQNGSILVTSRSQAVALKLVEEKDIVAVQPMAPSHALALIEKKLEPLGQALLVCPTGAGRRRPLGYAHYSVDLR